MTRGELWWADCSAKGTYPAPQDAIKGMYPETDTLPKQHTPSLQGGVVDFGIPFGSEPGYKRPVLIIQNDFFNNSKINTTIVIPVTTNLLLADAPGNILISKKESKLTKDSVIVMSQIEVIDRQRLIEKITKVDRNIIEKIEHNVLFILGIMRI